MAVAIAPRTRRTPRLMVVALVALAAAFGPLSTVNADGPVDQQQAKVKQIADELDNIGNRLDQLDEDYNGALDRKAALDSDIADRQAKVAAHEAELATLQQQLSKIAVDRYVSGGSTELSPLFVDAQGYADAQQRAELGDVALDNGTGDADRLQGLVDEFNNERKELESKQREQADLMASLEAKRKQGAQLQSEYEDKLAKAEAELGDLVQQEQERRAAEAVAAARAQIEAARQQAAAEEQAKAAAAAASQPVSRGGGQAPEAAEIAPATNDSPAAETPSVAAAPAAPVATAAPTAPAAPEATVAPDAPAAPAAPEAPAAPHAPPPATAPPPPSSRAGVAVNAALGQQGVPYRFAAESPGVAFDCSGLTKYAWGQAGVYLPHQSRQQYASTPHVPQADSQPGDLVFYHSPISHVALYLGDGSIIEAPRPGDVVHIRAVNWGNVVGVSRPG